MSDHNIRPESLEGTNVLPSGSEITEQERAATKLRQIEAGLRLKLVPGVGPKTFSDLVKHFGSPGEVLAAAPAELRCVPGVGAGIVSAIAAAPDDASVQQQIKLCNEHGIDILTAGGNEYCLLYTSPSPRDLSTSRMPSSA